MRVDAYTKRRLKIEAVKSAESEGKVADSMEYRMALMQRVHDGEITLEDAQAQLKRTKRNAKKNGQTTRNSVFVRS
jgi:polysaccharide deacetylase 2 family uncharacterized protein YibQ